MYQQRCLNKTAGWRRSAPPRWAEGSLVEMSDTQLISAHTEAAEAAVQPPPPAETAAEPGVAPPPPVNAVGTAVDLGTIATLEAELAAASPPPPLSDLPAGRAATGNTGHNPDEKAAAEEEEEEDWRQEFEGIYGDGATSAVVRIQSIQRGKAAREGIAEQNAAATKVQAVQRGKRQRAHTSVRGRCCRCLRLLRGLPTCVADSVVLQARREMRAKMKAKQQAPKADEEKAAAAVIACVSSL
jgi:hypothetical protein